MIGRNAAYDIARCFSFGFVLLDAQVIQRKLQNLCFLWEFCYGGRADRAPLTCYCQQPPFRNANRPDVRRLPPPCGDPCVLDAKVDRCWPEIPVACPSADAEFCSGARVNCPGLPKDEHPDVAKVSDATATSDNAKRWSFRCMRSRFPQREKDAIRHLVHSAFRACLVC